MIKLSFCILLSAFMLPVIQVVAQNSEDSVSVNKLPDDLLSGKSILFVDPLPDPKDKRLRGEWLPIADEAQPFFKRAGIDVVATYHLGDIQSGPEAEEAFMQFFKERDITHMVVIHQLTSGYRIEVSSFENSKLNPEMKGSWSVTATDLRSGMSQLYRAAANSGQEVKNLLILENAVPGVLLSPINGRRSEFYDLNLQSDKLAIRPFADTAKIRKVMEFYPYKYQLVGTERPERELRADGFQFILYYIHSTGESVRQILGYETDSELYLTEAVKDGDPYKVEYDKDLPVYKFYIKHIYSGNVFLGRNYDAAPEWEEALTLYISNLRKELLNN